MAAIEDTNQPPFIHSRIICRYKTIFSDNREKRTLVRKERAGMGRLMEYVVTQLRSTSLAQDGQQFHLVQLEWFHCVWLKKKEERRTYARGTRHDSQRKNVWGGKLGKVNDQKCVHTHIHKHARTLCIINISKIQLSNCDGISKKRGSSARRSGTWTTSPLISIHSFVGKIVKRETRGQIIRNVSYELAI